MLYFCVMIGRPARKLARLWLVVAVVAALLTASGAEEALAGPLPQGPEGIDHARHTGKPPEKDEPAPAVVHDAFIVDEGAFELHETPQHVHIVFLAFDGMGKECIGFILF